MTRLRNRIPWGLLTFFFGFVSWMKFAADQDENDSSRAKLSGYIESLSALDLEDLDSVQEGLRQFGTHFEGASADDRDAAFLAFREFYYGLERHRNREVWPNGAVISKELVANLNRNGLRLENVEGAWYADERPDFLLIEFGPQVSQPVREFLQIRVIELKEGFSNDAALTISFENVAGRLATWERYLTDYPHSPLVDEAEYFYRVYTSTLLWGSENTPVIGHQIDRNEPVRVHPSIREIYRKYIRKNPDTQSGATVKDFLSALERGDFARSAEVRAFYADLSDWVRSVPRPDSW